MCSNPLIYISKKEAFLNFVSSFGIFVCVSVKEYGKEQIFLRTFVECHYDFQNDTSKANKFGIAKEIEVLVKYKENEKEMCTIDKYWMQMTRNLFPYVLHSVVMFTRVSLQIIENKILHAMIC